MATRRDDGTTLVWDLTTGELVYTLQAGSEPLWFADFTQDNSLLLTVSDLVQVWDMADGSLIRELPQLAGVGQISTALNSLELSQDYVITAHSPFEGWSGGVILWSIATGEEVRRYTTPTGSLVGMMSPNGQYLLAANDPR